jgi:AraC family transcriptional regulator of adaptative response/methylated-DNA-[protein]-cysteine methyltransferase
MSLFTKNIDTPVGPMWIAANDDGICLFEFEDRRRIDQIMKRITSLLSTDFIVGHHPYHTLLEAQVSEYFAGTRKTFDLPLQLVGSEFQKKVWTGLLDIPFGKTRSYKEQSIFLGDEKAIRAVAGANGQNSIAIIVPCHRVIGSSGSLTGYGGGLQRKQWLLEHEAKYAGHGRQMDMFGE